MSSQPVIDARVIELSERAHRESRLADAIERDACTCARVWSASEVQVLFERIEHHRANAAEYQRRLREITG